ncbi:MAG: hypothetical protein AAGJ18_20565 [Bacteroidota bacterium]
MTPTIKLYENAIIDNNEDALKEIHLPAKNIAIYERDTTALSQELSQLMEQPIKWEAEGIVAEILASVNEYFAQNFANCSALLADIIGLVD